MTLYQKLFKKFQERSGYSYKKHQEEGMLWCIEKETTKPTFQGTYGGFIADEMGCGKTFMMISLIVCNFVPRTLVVAPLALINQWAQAIRDITGYDPLIYHGQNIKTQSQRLPTASIIITTYGVLSNHHDSDGELFRRNWNRVIYDEAHHMRGNKTKKYAAGLALPARVKWLVTGTPMQNKMADFHNLCSILGIKSRSEDVTSVILRRTKEGVGIKLPNLIIEQIEVPWANAEEKALYKVLDDMKDSGITRHPTNDLSLESDSKTPIVRETAEYIECDDELCDMSNISHSAEPKIVSDCEEADIIFPSENTAEEMHNLVRSVFGKFRLPYFLRAKQMCVCPNLLQSLERNINHCGLYNKSAIKRAIRNTTKIDQVICDILERIHNGNKKIVFCHFRKEMELIYERLMRAGVDVAVCDGRTPKKVRKELTISPPTVLILQNQMGCEGLNLQRQNEMYVVSQLWNPGQESQMIGRSYRIGQKKETYVYKYVMSSISEVESMDSYMIERMKEKREKVGEIWSQ